MAESWPHGRKPCECVCRICKRTFFAWDDLDVCPECQAPPNDPWSSQL